jgi:hypothetical protein
MRYSSKAVALGFLAAGFAAAVGLGQMAAEAAAAQAPGPAADRDLKEVQSYRLSMPVVQKLSAIYKTVAAEDAKDPKRQQLVKKKAELKALESKEEPTEAEQERMSVLADEIQRLEEAGDANATPTDNPTTLAEMARRVDSVPALAAAVRGAGMTSREFATAQLALMQTGIAHALLKSSPAGTPPPAGVLKENLEFFRLHEKELESLFASLDKDSADR